MLKSFNGIFTIIGIILILGNDDASAQINGKIVGGITVPIAEFTYQLSLRVSLNHTCGASVIHTSWALTAAQCTVGVGVLTTLTIKSGSSILQRGGTIHQVDQNIVHSSFNPKTMDYDLALLKVSPAFNSAYVINLPAAPMKLPAGTNTTVSGWGVTSAGASALSYYLQAVSVPIVSDASCSVSYPGAITLRMLCAGFTAGGKDSCQGDNGGPLVTGSGSGKTLVGVVSWGKSCALPNYPRVYTNVSYLRAWIKSSTGNVV